MGDSFMALNFWMPIGNLQCSIFNTKADTQITMETEPSKKKTSAARTDFLFFFCSFFLKKKKR